MAQTKKLVYRSLIDAPVVSQSQQTQHLQVLPRLLPIILLFCTACAMLFINAVLPLRGLWFYDSLVARLGSWTLFPTRFLFPHLQVIFGQARTQMPIPLIATWKETGLLFAAFTLVFLLYLLAVYILPPRISQRYILLSTVLLGLVFVFCPIVTSQDLFSYIAYARMEVIYHLNPLTTVPAQISHDPVYPNIFWVNQPSIYGPVWTLLTCALQWVSLLVFGAKQILPMVLFLRLFNLAFHIASVQLVWSIIGQLQHLNGRSTAQARTRRIQATLAFAWNPLLLFEGCVNAHTDTAVLFLLLLALWFLLPRSQKTRSAYVGTAVFFALAICLKINYVLLLPGFLLFLWAQQLQSSWLRRFRKVAITSGIFAVVSILLYIPFWGHGEIIHVVSVNPNTAHDSNSLYEVALRFYAGRTGTRIASFTSIAGSPLEHFTHISSYVIFFIVYAVLCLRAFFYSKTINTPSGLLRWLALAWLLYCLLGSPWFWPWYITTFFGLFALIEADEAARDVWFGISRIPLTVRVLAFTMVSVCCFYTWGPHLSFVHYLFHAQWVYLRGLWLWLLPFIILCTGLLIKIVPRKSLLTYNFSGLPRLKREQGSLELR